MYVIGTAGHVDHGKTSLVAALTGINPDRLKEEQEREMTIDLGFAWMTLPGGEEVGIVDVPGHRDFIENMLAGIGGIDAVLLVIAADEGVMPQTREHLAIVDLLHIPLGVIVISKTDLVDEPAWFEMLEGEIRQVVSSTVLENAPIIRTSIKTGNGLEDLKDVLADILRQHQPRGDFGRPRLPVDRVFSIHGFGTVATGTLLDGVFKVGDEIEILPEGVRGRIRGLQSYKHKVSEVRMGSRVAMNISGIDVNQFKRGSVVVKPGQYQSTSRLDVRFRLLPDASHSLRHNDNLKLFIGSAEVSARIRLLGEEELKPGLEGWLQVETQPSVVAVRGDRFILRKPSPAETIGGGMVVEPFARRRYKRFDREVIHRLDTIYKGTPAEVLGSIVFQKEILTGREILSLSHFSKDILLTAVEELVRIGLCIAIDPQLELLHPDQIIADVEKTGLKKQRILAEIEKYHQKFPLRAGIPMEELRTHLREPLKFFQFLLNCLREDKRVVEKDGLISLAGYKPEFTQQQQRLIDSLSALFEQHPFTPPSVKECTAMIGEELFHALIQTGQFVQVSADVVFRYQEYQILLNSVSKHFLQYPTLTVAQFRDQFQTSRRYALAFLEYLDTIGVTVRDGDVRKRR